MKRILICRLMVFLTVALVSCSDDTSESIPQNPDKDMYLRVNVPRTYASGADETDSKETVINGIDVLVFAPGTASQSGLFLKSVSEGTPVTGKNTFQVTMPVGEGLEVHVFTNCHEELVRSGAYKGLGMKMDALLEKMISKVENNSTGTDCLPMHGFLSGVTVAKESVGKTLSVPVLRSVAAVQAKVDEARRTPHRSDSKPDGSAPAKSGQPSHDRLRLESRACGPDGATALPLPLPVLRG